MRALTGDKGCPIPRLAATNPEVSNGGPVARYGTNSPGGQSSALPTDVAELDWCQLVSVLIETR